MADLSRLLRNGVLVSESRVSTIESNVMRAPTPKELFIRRFIGLPMFFIAVAGLLLLLWSPVAWLFGIPSLVHGLPDWVPGILMLNGGWLLCFIVNRMTSYKSGLLMEDERLVPRPEQKRELRSVPGAPHPDGS
jgi:hypothetical protein